jgi:uncharacterized protein YqeY
MDLLAEIDRRLLEALKTKNAMAAATLRGLKSRAQNEQIAKGKPLEDGDIVALVRSEIKRRKEAAAAYQSGNRPELAEKEMAESELLSGFVPAGPSVEAVTSFVDTLLEKEQLTMQDFGKTMGRLKAAFPDADGSQLSQILKEKLSS